MRLGSGLHHFKCRVDIRKHRRFKHFISASDRGLCVQLFAAQRTLFAGPPHVLHRLTLDTFVDAVNHTSSTVNCSVKHVLVPLGRRFFSIRSCCYFVHRHLVIGIVFIDHGRMQLNFYDTKRSDLLSLKLVVTGCCHLVHTVLASGKRRFVHKHLLAGYKL